MYVEECILKKFDPTSAQGSKKAPKGTAVVRVDMNGEPYTADENGEIRYFQSFGASSSSSSSG